MPKCRINLGSLSGFCYLRESCVRAFSFIISIILIFSIPKPFDKGSDSVFMVECFSRKPDQSPRHEAQAQLTMQLRQSAIEPQTCVQTR